MSSPNLLAAPDTQGEWGPVINSDIVAVHTVLMPTGNVLMWEEGGYQGPMVEEIRTWNPTTGVLSTPKFPPYDIFCAGHSVLPDGRVFLNGGHDNADGVGETKAVIYDPFQNDWQEVPPMNDRRWYATNTILPNGDVLVLGGSVDSYAHKNTLPQVWELQNSSWRNLVNANQAGPIGIDFYPRMFVLPDGRLYKAGPDRDTWFLNTSGSGQWTRGPDMNHPRERTYGSTVMLEPGKIMIIGGGEQPPTNTAEIIDFTNDPNPRWQYVAPMKYRRRHMNATLLADGKVLVTSGTTTPGFNVDAGGAVQAAELYDPEQNTWTEMTAMKGRRVYHSTAILLPDARVLVAGGGRPDADAGISNPNLEVFSPPYLFKGPRPQITNAPEALSYGESFNIQTTGPLVDQINFIRLGATTHAFDQTQIINKLQFTNLNNGQISVGAPSLPNDAGPGYYMLFALSNGVPSTARIIKFGDAQAPTQPENLRLTANNTLSWNASTDNVGVIAYRVYRNGQFIAQVQDNQYQINGGGQRDSYGVEAIDAAGNRSPMTNLGQENPDNQAPVANAGMDISTYLNQAFTLNANQSQDPDGDTISFKWLFEGQVIGNEAQIVRSHNNPGTYIYTLEVSDSQLTSVDQIQVTVAANEQPIEIIRNGSFDEGLNAWQGIFLDGGYAQFFPDNGRALIRVYNAGAQPWSVQFFQNIALQAGKKYELEFLISSSRSGQWLSVIAEEDGGSYQKYYEQRIQFTQAPYRNQRFQLQWQQSQSNNLAKLGFHFGRQTLGDFFIDQVTLREVPQQNRAKKSTEAKDQITLALSSNQKTKVFQAVNLKVEEDPVGQDLKYHWIQVHGPRVELANAKSNNAVFVPTQSGKYQFHLEAKSSNQSSSLDIRKSLIITDLEVLRNFPLKRTLEKLLSDAQDHQQTPSQLIYNFALGRQGCGSFNSYPQSDRLEAPEYCSDPGALNLDLVLANQDSQLSYYKPIALVNRIDLRDPQGSHCGEYRIAYAGQRLGVSKMNFMLFEAVLPNPQPSLGEAGCKKVADFWAKLSELNNISEASEQLTSFFYQGVDGMNAAVSLDHFRGAENRSGQIRFNARHDRFRSWTFMEFHAGISPEGLLKFTQSTIDESPFLALAGSTNLPAAESFQQAVLDGISQDGIDLLAHNITTLAIDLPDQVNVGRQFAHVSIPKRMIDELSEEFADKIQKKLNSVGSPLKPEEIIARVQALSCAGCHNQKENLGGSIDFNTAPVLMEFLSTYVEQGENGERFKLKQILEEKLLPERTRLLELFLDRNISTIEVE